MHLLVGAAMCSACLRGLVSMAAGHNALRRSGPGQKDALKRRTGTLGLSRSVGRLAWVRYAFIALSNFVSGIFPACSCCYP